MPEMQTSRFNPLRYLQLPPREPHAFRYQQLPLRREHHFEFQLSHGCVKADSTRFASSSPSIPSRARSRWMRCCGGGGSSSSKFPLRICFPTLVIALLLLGFLYQPEPPTEDEIHRQEELDYLGPPPPVDFFWRVFPMLHGFYHGVYDLVPFKQWEPEEALWDQLKDGPILGADGPTGNLAGLHRETARTSSASLGLDPIVFHPYPDYASAEYTSRHHHVEPCFLDPDDTMMPPDTFAYPGVTQHTPMPAFGSYEELGLSHDVCFDRFGRFGPYGYGYDAAEGGLGIGLESEHVGTDHVWARQPRTNWTGMDWGRAQDRCLARNKDRFGTAKQALDGGDGTATSLKLKVPRTAFLFRTWTGFEYTSHELLTLRSTINELSLKSGGEYHVYLLLHVRDDSIPIWASQEVARQVIEANVPEEFWGITVLWSVQQMRMYYPGPFEQTFDNPSASDIHEVYRGNHFPLQWFAAEHPEYDFVWNWEMDMRYSGHHYEFHDRVGTWAKAQPRRGLWERNEVLWIPAYHGDWANFTRTIEQQTIDRGEEPIWGPVSFERDGRFVPMPETQAPRAWRDDDFEWGVGEEADLITFDPIFDAAKSTWVFRDDITGFSLDLPIPPRRVAIVTVARMSRRLLDIMHRETYADKHSAFPEMWPATVALQHGLKAVYIPHPVYFDRKWPLDFLDRTFNRASEDDSLYGWGEHNFLGSSFYFNAEFAGSLWRRWLGQRDHERGGHRDEVKGSGRMCLRSTLHHPVKAENFPE